MNTTAPPDSAEAPFFEVLVTRKEALALTDEEFEQKLTDLVSQERDPETARRKLDREGRLPGLKDRFQEQKTLSFLLDGATVHRILKPRERSTGVVTP